MYQFRLNAIECSNSTFKFRQQHRLLTTILKHNCFLYIVEYVFNLPSYIVQNTRGSNYYTVIRVIRPQDSVDYIRID